MRKRDLPTFTHGSAMSDAAQTRLFLKLLDRFVRLPLSVLFTSSGVFRSLFATANGGVNGAPCSRQEHFVVHRTGAGCLVSQTHWYFSVYVLIKRQKS